jgi:hypothetical protein
MVVKAVKQVAVPEIMLPEPIAVTMIIAIAYPGIAEHYGFQIHVILCHPFPVNAIGYDRLVFVIRNTPAGNKIVKHRQLQFGFSLDDMLEFV